MLTKLRMLTFIGIRQISPLASLTVRARVAAQEGVVAFKMMVVNPILLLRKGIQRKIQ